MAMTHARRARRARRCSTTSTAPAEYTAVFTLNASGALKLVGESYPFAPGGRLLLTVDNHNSVNGIREFARAQGRRRRLRAADRARTAHRSARDRGAAGAGRSGARQPVRVPGAVEFLRASSIRLALIDAAHGPRLGRAARCGGVRADQPPRSAGGDARFRRHLLLQDVRLPDRRRLPADPQRRRWRGCAVRGSLAARSTSPPCRDNGTCCRRAKPASRTARSNYLSIPAVEIGLRHLERDRPRRDPDARPLPDRLAAERAARAPPRQRAPADPHLRTGNVGAARRHDHA